MSPSTIRTGIIGLVLILIAGGGVAFSVLQVTKQSEQLNQQLETLQTERAQEAGFQRLERLAEETTLDRAQLASYFLARESESIDFLNLVESLAPKAGVSLTTSGLTIVPGEGDQQWIEVGFEFTGSQFAVERFLTVLENVPYVSKVMEVRLESRSNDIWQATVKMQVMMFLYEDE